MSGSSQGKFVLFLVAILALQAVLLFWNGLLMITMHEGDALHSVQILLRMEMGQTPHVDFMTPIGFMAFSPIALFLDMGVGKAFLAGNILMAALSLPAIWWVASSRLSTGLAYAFGAAVIVLFTSTVHGETLKVTSISMYYNRWAWAISFMLILLALSQPRIQRHQIGDGLVLGLGLSFLALSKVTFFIALFPAILVALVLRAHWRAAATTVGVGILSIAAVTILMGGVEFWLAYIDDLRTVSSAGVRTYPSESFTQLLVGPSFLLLNLIILLGVVFLRQAGESEAGIVLLLLAPAFVYITYQNWGNDPQWLFVLGIALLALRPMRVVMNGWGWNLRTGLGVLGLLALVQIAPSVLNLSLSAWRLARLDPTEFSVVLRDPKHANLVVETKLVYLPEERRVKELPHADMAALGAPFREIDDVTFNGEDLQDCRLFRGLIGVYHSIARDLQTLDFMRGKSVLVADLFSNLWLFGDTIPIKNGAPWYYGGDVGVSNADYLLVPSCPGIPTVWAAIIEQASAPGAPDFKEIRRTDEYTLFERQ